MITLFTGYIFLDSGDLLIKGTADIATWVKEGKLDVTEGEDVHEVDIDQVPAVWQRLFTGNHKAKLISKLVY